MTILCFRSRIYRRYRRFQQNFKKAFETFNENI